MKVMLKGVSFNISMNWLALEEAVLPGQGRNQASKLQKIQKVKTQVMQGIF